MKTTLHPANLFDLDPWKELQKLNMHKTLQVSEGRTRVETSSGNGLLPA